ncbi:MAG: hypothetical protein JNM27_21370 [Leptospirales bacterium]|nr:hypothetical protein [Leptospirales bacterium]
MKIDISNLPSARAFIRLGDLFLSNPPTTRMIPLDEYLQANRKPPRLIMVALGILISVLSLLFFRICPAFEAGLLAVIVVLGVAALAYGKRTG